MIVIKRAGDYDRGRRKILDDLSVKMNNEQKIAEAIQGRLSGDPLAGTAGTVGPDNRTQGQRRADFTIQQNQARTNMMQIMDIAEVGDVLSRFKSSLPALQFINQNFPAIKAELSKQYADITADIFVDFIEDLQQRRKYGGVDESRIVGTKGGRQLLIDEIRRLVSTAHYNLDAAIETIQKYLRNGTPAFYPGLENDFQLIRSIKLILPDPRSPVFEDALAGAPVQDLEHVRDVMGSFPNVRQVQELLNTSFDRAGRLRTGQQFKRFVQKLVALFGIRPDQMVSFGLAFGILDQGQLEQIRDMAAPTLNPAVIIEGFDALPLMNTYDEDLVINDEDDPAGVVMEHVPSGSGAAAVAAAAAGELEPEGSEQGDPEPDAAGAAAGPAIDTTAWFVLPDGQQIPYASSKYLKSFKAVFKDAFGLGDIDVVDGIRYNQAKATELSRIASTLLQDGRIVYLAEEQQKDAASRFPSLNIRTSWEYCAALIVSDREPCEPWRYLMSGRASAGLDGSNIRIRINRKVQEYDQTLVAEAAAAAAAPAPTEAAAEAAAAPAAVVDQQAAAAADENPTPVTPPETATAVSAAAEAAPAETSGSGLRRRFRRRIIMGRGVAEHLEYMTPKTGPAAPLCAGEHKYQQFGRCCISLEGLARRKLILKQRNGAGQYLSVDRFPIRDISGEGVAFMESILRDPHRPDYLVLGRCGPEEKRNLFDAVCISGLNGSIQLPDDMDPMIERFNLVSSHIVAGGNSREEVQEMKGLLLNFVKRGMVSHRKALAIIQDLEDL